MTKLELQGDWNEIKGRIKETYADLTDNDLLYKEGHGEETLGLLQQKLGKTKEEVEEIIDKHSSFFPTA